MSSLYAFLHPVSVQEEREVFISDRFKDENGNVVPFKIRAITQDENEELVRKSRKKVKDVAHRRNRLCGIWKASYCSHHGFSRFHKQRDV